MRDLLGLAAVLVIALSALGGHRASELDPPAIDAGLSQAVAWVEAEAALPRLLIYVRCAIDRWMVETNGKSLEDIEPPQIDLEDWEEMISRAALVETASELKASAEVELRRNPGPGGVDEDLNSLFLGGGDAGMIRVRGALNVSTVVRRGLAETSAVRNYTFTVVHPLRYYSVIEAHREAAAGIGEIAGRAVFFVGVVNSSAELLEASDGAMRQVIGEVRALERELRLKYSKRGLSISFDVVLNGTELDLERRGEWVEATHRATLLIRVWVEDPEVRYWWKEERTGWGCYSEGAITVVTRGLLRREVT
ncbi:MAG: hypothetical protein QI223_00865 [Candidatus Korarchaeota archaeon]|nr:hypothetical protein [Candidatus Korarchaeota archaeon]